MPKFYVASSGRAMKKRVNYSNAQRALGEIYRLKRGRAMSRGKMRVR